MKLWLPHSLQRHVGLVGMPVQVSGSSDGLCRQAQQIKGLRCTRVCRGLSRHCCTQSVAGLPACPVQQKRDLPLPQPPHGSHTGAAELALRRLDAGLLKTCQPCNS